MIYYRYLYCFFFFILPIYKLKTKLLFQNFSDDPWQKRVRAPVAPWIHHLNYFVKLTKNELHSEFTGDGRGYRTLHIDTTNTKTILNKNGRNSACQQQKHTLYDVRRSVDEMHLCNNTPEIDFKQGLVALSAGAAVTI